MELDRKKRKWHLLMLKAWTGITSWEWKGNWRSNRNLFEEIMFDLKNRVDRLTKSLNQLLFAFIPWGCRRLCIFKLEKESLIQPNPSFLHILEKLAVVNWRQSHNTRLSSCVVCVLFVGFSELVKMLPALLSWSPKQCLPLGFRITAFPPKSVYLIDTIHLKIWIFFRILSWISYDKPLMYTVCNT